MRWVIVSETVLRYGDLDQLRRLEHRVGQLDPFEKVAENSRLCRVSFGSRLMMRVTSGMKPMSSMRSASVQHQRPHALEVQALLLDQIEQAAGVATRNSTPRLIASICGLISTPP